MANYAYMSKDKSYALKHYGVKGMKWRKHLKKKIDKKIGLNERKKLENTRVMAEDIAARGSNSPFKNNRTSIEDQLYTISKRQIPYRAKKYASTPLSKLERQSKLGKITVSLLFGNMDRNVKKKLRKVRSRRNAKTKVSYADNENFKKYSSKAANAAKGLIGYKNKEPIYKKGSPLWIESEAKKKAKLPKAKKESFWESLSPRKKKEKQIRNWKKTDQRLKKFNNKNRR